MISWMRYFFIKKKRFLSSILIEEQPKYGSWFLYFSSLICRVSFGSRVVSLDRFLWFNYIIFDCSVNFRLCWVESENWPILQFYRHFFLALRKRFFYLLIENRISVPTVFWQQKKVCVFLFVSYFQKWITGNVLWESVAKMTQLIQWDSLIKC